MTLRRLPLDWCLLSFITTYWYSILLLNVHSEYLDISVCWCPQQVWRASSIYQPSQPLLWTVTQGRTPMVRDGSSWILCGTTAKGYICRWQDICSKTAMTQEKVRLSEQTAFVKRVTMAEKSSAILRSKVFGGALSWSTPKEILHCMSPDVQKRQMIVLHVSKKGMSDAGSAECFDIVSHGAVERKRLLHDPFCAQIN